MRASSHITNFTAAHESLARTIGKTRLSYPDNHIESDNRLSWFLGRLDRAYGDNAYYVHLYRDPAGVADSYADRMQKGGIMYAYANGIYEGKRGTSHQLAREAAADYVETVTANIRSFLKDKSHQMDFDLARSKDAFAEFWDFVGAEGDRSAALAEWDQRHNSRVEILEEKERRGKKSFPVRVAWKLQRIAVKLPRFIEDA